jgi:hypothetical protein
MSCFREELVIEAGDSSGAQRKGRSMLEAATEQRLMKT